MSNLRVRTQAEIVRDIDSLLPLLEDLHKQATEERSHYYTGSLIEAAMITLELARYWLGPQPQPQPKRKTFRPKTRPR